MNEEAKQDAVIRNSAYITSSYTADTGNIEDVIAKAATEARQIAYAGKPGKVEIIIRDAADLAAVREANKEAA